MDSEIWAGCERVEPLKSSNLKRAGAREGWLVVEFLNGAVYRYAGAAQLLDVLANAESPGRYFNSNVARSFRYEKLGQAWPPRSPMEPDL